MKRSSRGMSFFGFVALADMIFAVSAGLLLLNPLSMDDLKDENDPTIPDPASLTGGLEKIERELARTENMVREASQSMNSQSMNIMPKEEKP